MTDPDASSADSVDPVDAIATALSRLRGRGPRAPWEGGPGGRGGPHGAGAHGDGHPPFGHHAHGDPGHGRRGAGFPGWQEAMQARMAGAARFRLLDALAAAPAPLTVSELAEAIGVDQPRASRLVQQAVDAGHVRREADPDDARRTRIALTDAARALVRGMRGQRRDALEAALAGFSDHERAQLAVLLAKLADAWPTGPPRG